MTSLAFKFEEITAAGAEARALRARRHLARHDRGSLQALPGVRRTSGTRSSRKLDDVDPRAANQVYSELRALKVDLTFAIGGIKNHEIYFEHLGGGGGDPDRPDRRSDRARLRLGAELARRPEGDRDGRPRLGVDGVRLGRGPPLQLHRRRAEHVPGLERDAARSRSTSTSTRTSSTTRPTAPRTSTRSSTTSTGRPSTTGCRSTRSTK